MAGGLEVSVGCQLRIASTAQYSDSSAARMFCRSYHCRTLVNIAVVTFILFCVIQLTVISNYEEESRTRYTTQASARKVQQNATTETPVTATAVSEQEVQWLRKQQERRKQMADHCQHAAPGLEQLLNPQETSAFGLLDVTIVDEEHQLIYCYVPRIATTNWRRIFLVLTGQVAPDMTEIIQRDPRDMSQFKTLRSYTAEQRLQMVKQFRKFLFARHPFHRLDAIYYDRLRYERTVNDNFQKIIGTDIIKRYRPAKFTSADSLLFGHDVRFVELVQFLTDDQNPLRMENVHFRSITNLCSPCQMNYTYIGKFETLREDAIMILRQMNASVPFGFPQPDRESLTSSRWDMDMRLLSSEQRRLLYKEYREDFELFGYDPDEWRRS